MYSLARPPGCRRSGFTVMELVVVLAVIAILAALLFPVFVQVRGRARKAACASNLHQIALAGMLYVHDYDDRFPSCYPTPGPPYLVDHRFLLYPYLKSWDLFYCPERHTVRRECLDPEHDFRPGARCMGYGYNWGSGLQWYNSFAKGDGLVRPTTGHLGLPMGVGLCEVFAPAHCFFFGDTNDYFFITLFRPSMPGVKSELATTAGTGTAPTPDEPPRHSGGNNFAFVDEHVQWLPFPGGVWIDGGPKVVPDMSMYSRTGHWESAPVP